MNAVGPSQHFGFYMSHDGALLLNLGPEATYQLVDVRNAQVLSFAGLPAQAYPRAEQFATPYPYFSPDGEWIALEGPQGLSLVRSDLSEARVVEIPPQESVDTGPTSLSMGFSADASLVGIVRSTEVLLVPTDGSATQSVPSADPGNAYAAWSPAVPYFFVVGAMGSITLVSASGEAHEVLASSPDSEVSDLQWSPDAPLLVYRILDLPTQRHHSHLIDVETREELLSSDWIGFADGGLLVEETVGSSGKVVGRTIRAASDPTRIVLDANMRNPSVLGDACVALLASGQPITVNTIASPSRQILAIEPPEGVRWSNFVPPQRPTLGDW